MVTQSGRTYWREQMFPQRSSAQELIVKPVNVITKGYWFSTGFSGCQRRRAELPAAGILPWCAGNCGRLGWVRMRPLCRQCSTTEVSILRQPPQPRHRTGTQQKQQSPQHDSYNTAQTQRSCSLCAQGKTPRNHLEDRETTCRQTGRRLPLRSQSPPPQ